MSGNVINLTINVTDANASEAVQQIVTQLNALGPAGAKGGAGAGAGLDKIGESALSNKEQVKLLSEEIGVHVPRAMQSVIAQSQLLSSAIGMIGPAMIGIGGVDILMHVGEAVHSAFEKFVMMKESIDSSDAVIKSFGDSAEAAMNRAYDATERYIRMTQGAGPADAYKLNRYETTPIGLPQLQSDDFKKLPDSMKGDLEKITGESIMPKDLPETITKLQQYQSSLTDIGAKLKDLPGLNPGMPEENGLVDTGMGTQGPSFVSQQQLIKATQRLIGDLMAKQADYSQQVMVDQQQVADDAKKKADEAIAKAKEKNDAILALENSARNAMLTGDALLEAQREEAIASFVSKYGQSKAAINAINSEYAGKELDLWTKQQDDADKAADAAKKSVTAQLDAQLLAADKFFDEDNKRQERHDRTMQQIAKEEEQAARLSLAPWQQEELAIEDEYDDRVRKVQDDVATHVMSEQDGAKAVTAAWNIANAEMQRSEEETRDKLAQGLQSLFSNPAQFFEKRAMDTAFQLMANEMLSTFKSTGATGGILQYLFGMGPQMNTSTNPLDAMNSALGIGHGAASGVSPSTMQFQQGTTLFSSSTTSFAAAVSQFASTATMGRIGGGGGGGFSGLGGGSFGGGSISSGGLGGGGDFSEYDSGSNPMMLPGIGGSSSSLVSAGSFDNSMMMPGLNSVAMDSALNNTGGAASMGSKGLGAAAGMAGGALMAGTSIYSAYQNSDPLSGLLGGAMGGMEAGAALGSIVPGIGTAVGAIGGALIGGIGGLMAGIFGDHGRGQAQNLDTNTIQPTLTKDLQDFEAGRAGYSTLASQLNSMQISAQNQTFQMGSGARSYFSERIQPEIQAVLSSLQKQEIGGRSNVTLSAAQYHDGGWVGDFGDLASSENEGFIHAAQNEFVVNPMAAAVHAPILQAMNTGTNFSYANSVQPRMPAGSSGGNVQLTIQALDSKSVAQWAKGGGGLALMAALNQAQKQYSGVGRG